MDNNLFSKVKTLIDEKNKEKQQLLFLLKKEKGIDLKEDQLEIKGKKIFLYLSSNQKTMFIKKEGGIFIKEKGFEI